MDDSTRMGEDRDRLAKHRLAAELTHAIVELERELESVVWDLQHLQPVRSDGSTIFGRAAYIRDTLGRLP